MGVTGVLLSIFGATALAGQVEPSQVPPIGIIDFYGLRTISEEQIRSVLGVKEGDPVPLSTAAVEARLAEIPGVARAELATVCCHEGRFILFVGIEETSATPLQFHPAPGGIALPPDVIETYRHFLDAWYDMVRSGEVEEDLSQGHSLIDDPTVRPLQERFVEYAEQYLDTLRYVLRNSGDPEQRAIAAWVIGYAQDKSSVVEDLLHAVLDPSATVRNNAVRAIGAIAVLADKRPELGIAIRPDPFIDMLNSLEWTDRNKALMVLATLTSQRDTALLEQLQVRVFPSLVEMASWHSIGHARPAYIILGRMAGLSEEEIEETWARGEREQIIAQIIQTQPS